ncbi:hypothetical protein V6N13_037874 [Hibiscus sabdariffa]
MGGGDGQATDEAKSFYFDIESESSVKRGSKDGVEIMPISGKIVKKRVVVVAEMVKKGVVLVAERIWRLQ